jgi:ABC-type sugar transport system ATPase subunit
VRPQDVGVHASAQANCIEGEIAMIQLVGSEKLVDLAYGRGGELTAQVKADVRLAIGQRVWIGFDAARLHLFDPASGRNLAPAG